MGTSSSKDRTDRLMQTMGFNEEDLAANRLGQLSFRQQDNLKQTGAQMIQSNTRSMRVALGVGAVVFIFLAVVMGNYFAQPGFTQADTMQVLPFMSIPVIIIAGALGYQIWRMRRMNQRLSSGKAPVKRYSGKVRLVVVNYGMSLAGLASSAAGVDPRQYRLQIGRATFYPPGPVFTAFQNGQKYTVYAVHAGYLPTILTAEAID